MIMPGNSHNAVFGMTKPINPIIIVAAIILKTDSLGAFVLVNLNTK